ncbi:hypothetical protein BDV06DRAFT_223336 [Aspergillus oleicola]
MAAWWTNDSCSPFTPANSSCTIGSAVRYTVNVTSGADVQTVLQFTDSHNIRLVIRNTGHDYLGKSTGPGAVALWTHHLKSIQYKPEYTSSWYTGPALSIGAGVQGFEAQDAAHRLGFVVVTGHSPDLGIAGGYTQGGGHGHLASQFGLAADQVLEWEVVTATGKILTASPAQNADLYWALSGGGGGTYAIVLSMTVRIYPENKTASGALSFTSTTGDDRFWEVVRMFLVHTLPLLDAGGTALWIVLPGATAPNSLTFLSEAITLPGGEKDKLQSYLASTLLLLQRYNMAYDYSINNFPTYHASITTAVNISEYNIGGRLISRSTVQSDLDSFISSMQAILRHNSAFSGFSFNVSRANDRVANAVHPAWRNAAVSVVLGIPYNNKNRQANLVGQKLITDVLVPQLESLDSPGEEAGAYLNEADWNQPDWQSAFYGSNYNRLLAIKNKYDPGQILSARTAVGSERWVEREDGRLCRV